MCGVLSIRAVQRISFVGALLSVTACEVNDAPDLSARDGEGGSANPTNVDGAAAASDDAAIGASTMRDAGRVGPDPGPWRDGGARPAVDGDAAVDSAVPSARDGGPCVEFVRSPELDCAAPSDGVLPVDLRCTGLYGDFDKRELACGVLEYQPAFQLWSDGAAKRRFVAIPPGQKVDVSDPDAFEYPIGTRFWKEFQVQGRDGKMRLGETRLLQKDAEGWTYTSYVWSEDERQARQMNNAQGVPNLYGTGHTVPTRDFCKECHAGRADFVLGWDAIMLGPGAIGLTRERLAALGLIENAAALALSIPGDGLDRDALGYLHANCGVSCHNRSVDAPAQKTGLHLRLEARELGSVQATGAIATGLNKPPADNAKFAGLPLDPGEYLAIRPGDPERSLVVARQKLRGVEGQMPRIATHKVDDAGVQVTSRWIARMALDGGVSEP